MKSRRLLVAVSLLPVVVFEEETTKQGRKKKSARAFPQQKRSYNKKHSQPIQQKTWIAQGAATPL